ncbi:hypothetical protein ACIGBL_31565 [Streptomyces sp. NPDC085614]|uniref:hypothetical protein n=1 Tax=Streptomyces sp. NPDC085614 TaxID=3365733 RepID=UPI0037D91A98
MDLAACPLALLDDDRRLRSAVGVITTVDNPTLLRWIRREAHPRGRVIDGRRSQGGP